MVFNRLTVVSMAESESIKIKWLCLCSCGVSKTVSGSDLRCGKTTSCGCYNRGLKRFEDLSGRRFGRFTVLKKSESRKQRRYWLCRCDCGVIKYADASNLKLGTTKSCGCWKRDNTSRIMFTHGLSKTKAYKTLTRMKQRCLNPNNPDYHHYGGRGIRICERWMRSVKLFIQDMGHPPTNSHSIERKSVNGNYEPGNCEWILKRDQPKNTRTNRRIEFNGTILHLSEWARVVGIHRTTIASRLNAGWLVGRALGYE